MDNNRNNFTVRAGPAWRLYGKIVRRAGGARRNLILWVTAFGLLVPAASPAWAVCGAGGTASGWYHPDWQYRKLVTVGCDMTPNTSQTNFPLLVQTPGGDANLSSGARSDGFDLVFTASDGTTKLDHEIERFVSGTGELTAWVKITSLAYDTDTNIYVYYGNPGASDQQNASGVWESGYKAVWHFSQTSGGADTVLDSTSNANHASTQTILDYQSTVDASASTSTEVSGRPYQNQGPWAAHGKLWIFYGDDTNFVWRTKQMQSGGSWSDKQTAVAGKATTIQVTMAFDGEYFHFAYYNNSDNDIAYKRGLPDSGGNITFDSEQTAWTDATFNGGSNNRHAILVDGNRHVWILFQAEDGTNAKPVILSSTNTSGGWTDRTGFPQDAQAQTNNTLHGMVPRIAELEDGKILFVWQDRVNSRDSAKLWTAGAAPEDEGTLGSLENTGLALPADVLRNSLIALPTGEAFANNATTVWRRATNGSWSNVSPGTMTAVAGNGLTRWGNSIRLWDYSGGYIRYTYSGDSGATWLWAPNKWTVSSAGMMNPGSFPGVDGDYNAVTWRSGASSYDLVMGIVGGVNSASNPDLNVEGQIGGGVEFDGTGFLRAAPSTSLDLTGNQVSLQAWIYMDQNQADDSAFVQKAPQTNKERYMLGTWAGASWVVNHRVTTADGHVAYSPGSFSSSVWQQFTAVYDGALASNPRFKAYLDGALLSSNNASGNILSSTAFLNIGKRGDDRNSSALFDGKLDEIRVYAGAFSADRVATEHNNQSAPGDHLTFASEDPLGAVTYTWTGSADGTTWEQEGNWEMDGSSSPGSDGYPDSQHDLAVIDSTSNSITTAGAVTVGELRLAAGFSGSVTLGGTLTLDDASALDGDLTIGAGTLDANDHALAIDGDTVVSGGTLKTGSGAVTFGNAAGDAVTISSGTLEIESGDPDSDITINASTWTNSGGTVSFLGGSSTTVFSALSAYHNLTINASGNTFTCGGSVDVNGDLTLAAGELSAGANSITVGGDWLNYGGTFTAGTGAVTLNSATTAAVLSGGEAFYNLNFATGTFTLQDALSAAGALTLTSGTLSQGASYNLTVSDTAATGTAINIANGAALSNTGTGGLTLGGGLVNEGTLTLESSDADNNGIAVRSSSAGVQRTWSGAGTFNLRDVDLKDQAVDTSTYPIRTPSSTNSGNNSRFRFWGMISM